MYITAKIFETDFFEGISFFMPLKAYPSGCHKREQKNIYNKLVSLRGN
jgi:hypothetical protein